MRPYPEVNAGRWQVSTAGGDRPLWSRSGQELFYFAAAGELMRVRVERAQSWLATKPEAVLKAGSAFRLGGPGRTYDVSSDGQRFLLVKQGGPGVNPAAPSLVVVQNWHEELKRLVPQK